MIKAWEDKQPGRAAKAKIIKALFELKIKQSNGEITEEELNKILQLEV